MILEVIFGACAIVCLVFLSKKDSEPLLGVYSQPGKWFLLKKLIFRLFLKRRIRHTAVAAASDKHSVTHGPSCRWYGVEPRVDEMECPPQLPDGENAIDSMYFNGLDAKGNYFVFRIARRHGRMAELWLSVNVPGVGFFQSPIHPDTNVYNVDSDTYSAGGLKFECFEPLNHWKITFNGLLRSGMCNDWSTEPFETIHVRISLAWHAFSVPIDFDSTIHPDCISTAVAREKWSNDFFKQLQMSHQTLYEQWGELWGTFQAEGHSEIHLHGLRGCRVHSYGERDWNSFHRYATCFCYLEDGSVFNVSNTSAPGTLSLLQSGYFALPSCALSPVSWTDMDLAQLGENLNPPKFCEFNFKADGKRYNVRVMAHTVLRYYLHEDWRSVVLEQISSYEVNGVKGYGIFEFLYRHPRESPMQRELSLPLLKESSSLPAGDMKALALDFSRPGCTSSKLVGGKGCQLALLQQLNPMEFSVPKGFCLTVRAFETQTKNSPSVQLVIDELHRTSCTHPEQLQSACLSAVTTFKTTPLCSQVINSIVEHLVKVFGTEYADVPLAVRSSAVGEDGTELSAAGQMETDLGVKGLQQILQAIANCWASQFAFPAVSYRREHGQPIKLPAGIVIQEMVPAAAAGVLFTRHPVTGNPGVMVINANYGLGESVVSGQSEPDEINVSRSWDDKLTILNETIGEKKLQIRMAASGGTELVSVAEDDMKHCCLSDEVVLRLARIGVELERRFSDPRDIEFAVDKDSNIYLLQARPITAIDHESDHYLIHEFDTALASDHEILTTCNIQEIMPGALTPLTRSAVWAVVETAFQKMLLSDSELCYHLPDKIYPLCSNQLFFNFSILLRAGACTLLGSKNASELSFLGETRDDITPDEILSYFGTFPKWKRALNTIHLIQDIRSVNVRISKWAEFLKTFTIAEHSHSCAAEVYDDIISHLSAMVEAVIDHLVASNVSIMWYNVLMTIVTNMKPVWKSEHYSDIALLLSKCEDVYSADVPAALQKLTKILADSSSKDTFVQLPVEEAVTWLSSDASGTAGKAFADFLSRHGHRCVREAELRETSWQTEPAKIVRVLQAMAQTSQQKKQTTDRLSEISDIKADLNLISRLMLHWLLPKARRAVGKREFTKSQATKTVEVFRQAYRKLAALMVNDSRLPDTDLIYFLTLREIRQVLETRSGRIIARAQRRRQLYPVQMEAKYPRIFRGHPKPIEEVELDGSTVHNSCLKLTGLPVSQGEVRGKARVVTSLDKASEIQHGEILIVPYTDIGWSPYFPMISGLVTEIGGIISHGAVIAREYGVPCVVKIPRATVLFKSGDLILLNGTVGTVEKLNC